MPKLEACWIILFNLFGNNPDSLSIGYQRKIARNLVPKLQVCKSVYTEAQKHNIDPLLAISVAYRETRFRNVESKKGAKGPMGVIPKYHCPKNKKQKCNYTKAGIHALNTYLELNQYELCPALAQYNRGNKGKCEKGRSEYNYAQDVLKLYKQLLNHNFCSSEFDC